MTDPATSRCPEVVGSGTPIGTQKPGSRPETRRIRRPRRIRASGVRALRWRRRAETHVSLDPPE